MEWFVKRVSHLLLDYRDMILMQRQYIGNALCSTPFAPCGKNLWLINTDLINSSHPEIEGERRGKESGVPPGYVRTIREEIWVFEWLGLKEKDKNNRLVAGKYLKQLLTLHNKLEHWKWQKIRLGFCAKNVRYRRFVNAGENWENLLVFLLRAYCRIWANKWDVSQYCSADSDSLSG